MTGEFECDSARRANALANALGKIEVMAVAGRKVRAGLSNADDWFAGSQFRRRKARSFRGFLDCRTKAVTAADETIYA
jgi:hypothetical protein